MKKRKRVLSVLMTACLVAVMMPITVFAQGETVKMQTGTAGLTVNESKVAFAGREWWVVGDGTSGIYPQESHITLLAADTQVSDVQEIDGSYYGIAFREGGSVDPEYPDSKSTLAYIA